MKVFVTGARGMVGSCLLRRLQERGRDEIFAPSRQELDLFDREAVFKYVGKLKPDLVVHLAAKVGGIQANITYPVQFLTENLHIGLNVVQAALESGVEKLVNIASSCIYEKDLEILQEQYISVQNLEPTNEGYALAKISILRLCEYVCRQYGFHYKTIIPCNIYGPDDNFDLFSGHMIPAAIHKVHLAKTQERPYVEIWGDGTARREFMFVDDLVNFIVLAMKEVENLPATVNVGLGHDYTINEYYQFVSQVVGYKGDFQHDLNKPIGMRRKLLDIAAAKRLGWEAKTQILDGIQKTYDNFLRIHGSRGA